MNRKSIEIALVAGALVVGPVGCSVSSTHVDGEQSELTGGGEDPGHPHGGPPGQTGEHPHGGPPGQTGEHPHGGPPGHSDDDDHDHGHGNDADGEDDDNPGRGRGPG